jgi:hypothetical protein
MEFIYINKYISYPYNNNETRMFTKEIMTNVVDLIKKKQRKKKKARGGSSFMIQGPINTKGRTVTLPDARRTCRRSNVNSQHDQGKTHKHGNTSGKATRHKAATKIQ